MVLPQKGSAPFCDPITAAPRCPCPHHSHRDSRLINHPSRCCSQIPAEQRTRVSVIFKDAKLARR